MDKINCPGCGEQVDPKRYFCPKCGKFLLTDSMSNKEKATEPERKLARIAANLKEHPHIEIQWNEAVDAYTQKVERIQSLLRLRDLGIQSAELTAKLNRFLELCRRPDFEIAFVGAVKAGKSTLINALLGRNYASTDPNPETAVLTKFRSSVQDYVTVKFYSEDEWKKLWASVQSGAEKFLQLYRDLDAETHREKWIGHEPYQIELKNSEIEAELKKWSSSQSPVHFFVKELEVGISSLPMDIPRQVVFVDTPGLFDPVDFRSQISRDYIHKANAVLVCIKAEDLHGEEVKTVESVFSFSGHKRNKVFLIATNWDKLNDVVRDWNKRYAYMVDAFTGPAFFPDSEMARRNILYVDSYHYNLCREYDSLNRYDKARINVFLMSLQAAAEGCEEVELDDLDISEPMRKLKDTVLGLYSPEDIDNLMKVTNVNKVRAFIVEEFVNQYEELLYGDIKRMYDDIRHMTARLAGDRKRALDERVTISNAGLQEIERKIQETKTSQAALKKVQGQLTAALKQVNKSTQKRLTSILSRLG